MERVDVAVVGAGPVGSAAAIGLARRGHSVVLLDRARFPRDKPCGEGIMPHGVEELRRLGLDGLAQQVGARPFRGIAYHLDGVTAEGDFPVGQGLAVRRTRFDAAFVEAATREASLVFRPGARVRRVVADPTGVSVRLDDDELRVRVVVAADGLHSPIRRQLGLSRERSGDNRYGVRAHYQLANGVAAGDRVEVFLDGPAEWYVTPLAGGEVNVALLCPREVTRTLAGDLRGAFEERGRAFSPLRRLLEGATPTSAPMAIGPLRQEVRGVVADRVVLVGDAAGFVDAITGEGMSIGLLSARLAVDALDEALRRDRLAAEDLRPYEVARKAAAKELYAFTELVMWALRKPALARWIVRNLRRRPEVFGELLGVATGQRRMGELSIRAWIGLIGGV